MLSFCIGLAALASAPWHQTGIHHCRTSACHLEFQGSQRVLKACASHCVFAPKICRICSQDLTLRCCPAELHPKRSARRTRSLSSRSRTMAATARICPGFGLSATPGLITSWANGSPQFLHWLIQPRNSRARQTARTRRTWMPRLPVYLANSPLLYLANGLLQAPR